MIVSISRLVRHIVAHTKTRSVISRTAGFVLSLTPIIGDRTARFFSIQQQHDDHNVAIAITHTERPHTYYCAFVPITHHKKRDHCTGYNCRRLCRLWQTLLIVKDGERGPYACLAVTLTSSSSAVTSTRPRKAFEWCAGRCCKSTAVRTSHRSEACIQQLYSRCETK